MKTILIIAPEGGMLLEATGIADIFTRANQLRPADAPEPHYQVTLATTQPHHVIHGASGFKLLA
ncbi:TPA: GlxA family transcriptional regulator, partial [Cronobacter sakazakii]